MSIIIPDSRHPILDRWLEAINARNVDYVCSLYHESAVMIPTGSNKVRKTYSEIREYYEELFAHEQLQAELLSCNVTYENGHKLDKGSCLFSWKEDGESHKLRARFSFVIHDGKVLVHHSSYGPDE